MDAKIVSTNKSLNINYLAGNEIQSSTPCVAYAVDGEKLVFAAFIGAEVGIDAAKALSYTKGFLHLSRARIKAKLPSEAKYFVWHKGEIPSLNKACSYVMVKAAEMVLDHENKTYVMSTDPNSSTLPPETIELMGQRISEIANVSVLENWYPEIVKAAREWPSLRSPLIHKIDCYNCAVYGIVKDGEKWGELVSLLLQANKIVITKQFN